MTVVAQNRYISHDGFVQVASLRSPQLRLMYSSMLPRIDTNMHVMRGLLICNYFSAKWWVVLTYHLPLDDKNAKAVAPVFIGAQ